MDIQKAEPSKDLKTFKPHAIIQADRRIPSPIFVASLLGPERILRIDFDTSGKPATYVHCALKQMNLKYPEGMVPAFGRIISIAVNYAPNHAVLFDLEGRALELLSEACRIGTATLSIKGKPLKRASNTPT